MLAGRSEFQHGGSFYVEWLTNKSAGAKSTAKLEGVAIIVGAGERCAGRGVMSGESRAAVRREMVHRLLSLSLLVACARVVISVSTLVDRGLAWA